MTAALAEATAVTVRATIIAALKLQHQCEVGSRAVVGLCERFVKRFYVHSANLDRRFVCRCHTRVLMTRLRKG